MECVFFRIMGKSIDDFVAKMRSVSYDRPEAAMRAMIDRRHLAPAWGGKAPLSPEPEDNLVIRTKVPGYIRHRPRMPGHHVSNHKGVTLIHSSTWQDQTSYQRTLPFQPRPAILTVVNLPYSRELLVFRLRNQSSSSVSSKTAKVSARISCSERRVQIIAPKTRSPTKKAIMSTIC